MIKKIAIIFLLFTSIITSAYKKPDVYVIEGEKNAQFHNNLGLRYLNERCYYAAIQEFKIAISLKPNSQATAIYYNNLGETYMKIGYPKYAQDCFERSINQYTLNLKFYQNLVKCYAAQGLTDLKIRTYEKNTKNPLNMVVLGLLYIEKGETRRGIIKLDEFCMQEPDLIITEAVKTYLKQLIAQQDLSS